MLFLSQTLCCYSFMLLLLQIAAGIILAVGVLFLFLVRLGGRDNSLSPSGKKVTEKLTVKDVVKRELNFVGRMLLGFGFIILVSTILISVGVYTGVLD